MATLYLRPSNDNNLRHSCSRGSSGYVLINEASQDGDSTYIYQSISSTSDSSVTSSFNLSGFSNTKIQVTKATLYIVAKETSTSSKDTATINFSVDCGGSTNTSGNSNLSTSYVTKSLNCNNIIANINNSLLSGTIPTITISISTSGKKYSSKNDTFQNRITQVYVQVDYEETGDEPTVYNFSIGKQPKSIRGSATLNKTTANAGESVTFSCTKLSNEYEFIGWFSDSSYSNLISTDMTYTVNAEKDLTLYPRIELLVTKSLSIEYGQGSTYLTANSVTLDFSMIGIQAIIAQYNQGTSGYARYNNTAMNMLYPTSTIHPVKLDFNIACGRRAVLGSLTDEDYIQFKIDNNVLGTYRPDSEANVQYKLTNYIDSSVVGSTSSSNIQFYCHQSSSGSTRSVGINKATLTMYYAGYKTQAVAGVGADLLKSVNCSLSVACEGENVTYTATPYRGVTFEGWYSDANCTNLVSKNATYTTPANTDLILYAKASGKKQTTYIKINNKIIEADTLYMNNNGIIVEIDENKLLQISQNKRLRFMN